MKYCIAFLIVFVFFTSCADKAEKKKEKPAVASATYQTAVVESGGVSTIIKLPAQLVAFQEVSIFPKVNGYVKTVSVDVGSRVSKGAALMSLEAPELEQSVLQAKEKYARTRTDYTLGKDHYMRLLEASKTAGAISPMDLATARSKTEADSMISNAEKANWQMQQTMMGYLRVTAPFSGVITERNVHPGALVSSASKDKPMLELKQTDHLRLQIDVPEALAANLKNKDTVSFYVSALQGKRLTGFISRRSMNINAQYRSERMEIDVPNPKLELSPGMYADVFLYSKGNLQGLWVPRSAVVTSTERKYVLTLENGKAKKVDVTTGNQAADKVEVYGKLAPGDKVIINATDEMN
ncbi:MAG: efflux RND transporter periplasmic adaptor subunit [Bacteroidota bacterium]